MLSGKHGGGMTGGLYRDGDWAQVSDGKNAVPVPRDQYEAKGYQPAFDDLPTREEYEASRA